jgi:hypothetical protein
VRRNRISFCLLGISFEIPEVEMSVLQEGRKDEENTKLKGEGVNE